MSTNSSGGWVRRFDRSDSVLHGCLMVSFLGVSLTGLPLLFSAAPWASGIVSAFGGFKAAGVLHRCFALLMIATFAGHLGKLFYGIFALKDYAILWGPRSMVPNPKDLSDMVGHLKWFLGLGERPDFDRFTYWEKFDYWAVFWGMAVIGGSGLMLWFPAAFSLFVPGWVFNVALIIHGEEALMATTFIFTVHFFNGHIRPEKFPMDTVIFTGRMPTEELRLERPAEWARVQEEGGLAAIDSPAPTHGLLVLGKTVGTIGVFLGLSLAGLCIYALVFAHH